MLHLNTDVPLAIAAAIAASRRATGQPTLVRLRNGAPAGIRAQRVDDAERLGEFFEGLSAASRGWRFDAGGRAPAALQQLLSADGVHHVAFVATLARPEGEQIIGEARYVVGPVAYGAEMAIAVADEWQGQGLAEKLLDTLLDAACDAGLRWLRGDVPAANARMVGFMRRMGFEPSAHPAGDPLLRLERGVAPRLPQPAAPRPPNALRRWFSSQFDDFAI